MFGTCRRQPTNGTVVKDLERNADPQRTRRITEDIPMRETKRVFVSHKSSNAKLASRIIEILQSEMNDVDFFLSEKINPGENWRADIVNLPLRLKQGGLLSS